MTVGTIISWSPDKHLKTEEDVIVMEGIIYDPKGTIVIGKTIYRDWTIRDDFYSTNPKMFTRIIELDPKTAVSSDYFLGLESGH
ncbi:MAG: hypothetical protein P8I55_05805 [Crocinitomix sp.]|nr:hypothetical protein [Crocinitomix sp.]